MGYELRLLKNGSPVSVNEYPRGSTCAYDAGPDGQFNFDGPLSEVSITFNYTRYLNDTFNTNFIYEIDGKTGAEALPIIREALIYLAALGSDEPDDDYFRPTSGNLLQLARTLEEWAESNPDAVFDLLG